MVAVKDLIDIAGRVTAAGNPTLSAGPPATRTAPCVEALLAAGATVVGKTATDELAMGMFGVNSHYGTPPNPAAPDRVPGGSSSGSASVVAAGIADLGIGTDTGGSIRVPGAFCGLVGLRPPPRRGAPTRGRP
ncbi:MAG: amidase, partial [Frankia sp.]|nr:amidase [Frankia sp.]